MHTCLAKAALKMLYQCTRWAIDEFCPDTCSTHVDAAEPDWSDDTTQMKVLVNGSAEIKRKVDSVPRRTSRQWYAPT